MSQADIATAILQTELAISSIRDTKTTNPTDLDFLEFSISALTESNRRLKGWAAWRLRELVDK